MLIELVRRRPALFWPLLALSALLVTGGVLFLLARSA
jgi:hypothetical protein